MDKVLLGLKIRQLREQKNLTQMQLAETIEMSDRALSNIEVGKVVPQLNTLIAISAALNVSLDYLINNIVGENTVELTLVNNLRNLLGPHHLEEGESYMVRPSSFIKGKTFWTWRPDMIAEWNDSYCLVETSLM